MFKNLIGSVTGAAKSAKDTASSKFNSASDTVKNAGLADKFTDKLKGMNQSVVDDWVGDKDAPDDRTFLEKLGGSAKKVGGDLAVTGIKVWLAMKDPKTDLQHKAILGAALAYFVLPVDMIPDVIAGVGFTDDAAALALAVNTVGSSITEEHEAEAQHKWDNFGASESDNEEIKKIE